jgi:hypothetical protein
VQELAIDLASQRSPVASQAAGRLLIAPQNRITRDESRATGLVHVRELLDALPLAPSDVSLAVSRLANGQRYLRSSELGAACYELRLLLRGPER